VKDRVILDDNLHRRLYGIRCKLCYCVTYGESRCLYCDRTTPFPKPLEKKRNFLNEMLYLDDTP
jgi:hypothetical protein